MCYPNMRPLAIPVTNILILLVPGEGFEPPTFGLQNRCTATVLTRRAISFQQVGWAPQQHDNGSGPKMDPISLLDPRKSSFLVPQGCVKRRSRSRIGIREQMPVGCQRERCRSVTETPADG